MKNIKVQFQWTELFTLAPQVYTHQIITTDVMELTFDEIKNFHKLNYKGSGGYVATDAGYLFDDWSDAAMQMHYDKLQQEIEKKDTIFTVELDYPWLRFKPVLIKTTA